jgi:hypothetical protein
MGHFKDSKWSLCIKSRLFWPQNGPRYRSCHLQGQKSLRPLEKSRFCAQGPFRILGMTHLVIFKGWFHKIAPHLQHRYINSYYVPLWPIALNFITLCFYVLFFYCFNNDMCRKPREISQFGKKSAKVYHSLYNSTEQLQVALWTYMFFKLGLNNEKSIHTLPLKSLHLLSLPL